MRRDTGLRGVADHHVVEAEGVERAIVACLGGPEHDARVGPRVVDEAPEQKPSVRQRYLFRPQDREAFRDRIRPDEVDVQRIDTRELDVGNALLSHVANEAADLLVMGGYGHSRLREIVLGGATRTVLHDMTVPVLMSH